MFLVLLIPMTWLGCFIVSKLFAMWSPGRALRAYRIAWGLAALFAGLVAMCWMAMVNDHSRDGGGGMAAGITAGLCFLGLLGALLNVFTCWLGARREARAAVEEQQGPGLSRS